MLIVAKYLHAAGFFAQSAQCVFHRAVRQITLKIDEETVLPVAPLKRPALNFIHIQIVIDKV